MRHRSPASLVLILSCAIWGWGQKQPTRNPQLAVFVYDRAKVSRVTLEEAERDAARVFARSVDIAWENCPPEATSPTCAHPPAGFHLTVRLIAHPLTLPDAACGVAFLNDEGGAYADVFFDPVKRLRGDDAPMKLAAILGHVMAHEIGHLLLGSHSHSQSGIMQGQWHQDELSRIFEGRLLFTAEQAAQIRTHVAAWVKGVSSSPDMAEAWGP